MPDNTSPDETLWVARVNNRYGDPQRRAFHTHSDAKAYVESEVDSDHIEWLDQSDAPTPYANSVLLRHDDRGNGRTAAEINCVLAPPTDEQ